MEVVLGRVKYNLSIVTSGNFVLGEDFISPVLLYKFKIKSRGEFYGLQVKY